MTDKKFGVAPTPLPTPASDPVAEKESHHCWCPCNNTDRTMVSVTCPSTVPTLPRPRRTIP